MFCRVSQTYNKHAILLRVMQNIKTLQHKVPLYELGDCGSFGLLVTGKDHLRYAQRAISNRDLNNSKI